MVRTDINVFIEASIYPSYPGFIHGPDINV